MKSNSARLDRLINKTTGIKRDSVKRLIAQKRISVDGCTDLNAQQLVNQFARVVFDNTVLQDQTAYYLMLHKPAGTVSATVDSKNPTVLGCVDKQKYSNLHIVGRLDFNSTGLLLLTNDGRWSRQINNPANNIEKVYRVKVEKPLDQDYVDAFSQGMYFAYENIHTRPAKLKILSDYVAEVRLTEGRYHQIKRMFGRFQNKVVGLHRLAVGSIYLDETLRPGEYRSLSISERSLVDIN